MARLLDAIAPHHEEAVRPGLLLDHLIAAGAEKTGLFPSVIFHGNTINARYIYGRPAEYQNSDDQFLYDIR
jgi:hypothetical protein